ncbi:MAG: S41 family peptidase [Marinicella sp.]
MNSTFIRLLFLLLLNFFSMMVVAQGAPGKLTKDEVSQVIKKVTHLLDTQYVHPEKAKKITAQLRKNHKQGVYNKFKDEMAFAEKLQADIHSVVQDTHLIFEYNPEQAVHILRVEDENNQSDSEQVDLSEIQRFNFGFRAVEILEGNIGYLKLDGFHDTDYASETAVAAMNFLSNADALIIDLRQNGGGSWKMIQLISSYLFDANPVHLSGFYWRPEDKYTQNWTLPYVPGKRSPDTDVYILTSSRTHSAAEEFSYNLKHLKRATVVGEVTVGGAHPGDFKAVSEHFVFFIPYGRSTNPITNSNWEGVGVIPDIEVSAADALGVAKTKALQSLSEKHVGDSGEMYRWYLVSEKAKLNPVKINEAILQTYAGQYGPRTLVTEGDQLFYQRGDGPKLLLNALQEDLFELAVDNSFRMKIIKQAGKVTALQGLYDNGFKDQHPKQ